jgi:hypothetical protein
MSLQKTITAKELADLLNGREYGKEITREEDALAAASNLVVAFGYSDDSLELRGAINDEIGAWNGVDIAIDIDDKVVLPNAEDDEYCLKCYRRARKILVKAQWLPTNPEAYWLITTGAHFEPFDIMEDGELFCRGAVFFFFE